MNEYELLRAEIMGSYAEINNCTNVLYATVAAILVFAVQFNNYLICMIPYVVIIPLFLLCQAKHFSICRLASYMYVYLEGEEYHWERRHHRFDSRKEFKYYIDTSFMYYAVSLICSVLALYQLYYSSFDNAGKWIRAIVVLLTFVVTSIIMQKSTIDYKKTRSKMIEIWLKCKNEELRAKQKTLNKEGPPCGKSY